MKKHQRYITTLSHAIVETSESIFSAAESCVRTLLSFLVSLLQLVVRIQILRKTSRSAVADLYYKTPSAVVVLSSQKGHSPLDLVQTCMWYNPLRILH